MKKLFLTSLFAGVCFAQPGVPTGFQCASWTGAGGDQQINLTWIRADDTDTSIVLSRATSSGGSYTFVPAAMWPTGSAHADLYNDLSALPATTYYYKVHATNGGGSSADAGPINCTTAADAANGFTGPAGSFTVTNTDAWTNTLTWTDPNSGFRYWQVQRSADGQFFATVDPVLGYLAATGYVDNGKLSGSVLTPGTTYTYRIRCINDSSFYTAWQYASVTNAAAPGGSASIPTGFTCTTTSDVLTTCNWTDTNSGAKTYGIYTSAFSNGGPSYSLITTTGAGATSQAITTTAETFYWVTIRADPAGTPSGYAPVVKVRTASHGAGTPTNYTICGSYTTTCLGSSVIINGLGPGDVATVAAGTYFEKILFHNRGTAAQHITIQCATIGACIIDGTNAISLVASECIVCGPTNFSDIFLVGFWNTAHNSGWAPGYIDLIGFELRNVQNGAPYTASTGARTYIQPSCVYLFEANFITLQNNTIHACTEGVFGAGNNDTRTLTDISVGVCPNGNYIYGNGEVSPSPTLVHNVYNEGINMTYECNKFGDLISGSQGAIGGKDRSAGLLYRYNRIINSVTPGTGSYFFLIGEAQNYAQYTTANPLFNTIQIYGNSWEDTTGTGVSSSPGLFGGWGQPTNWGPSGRVGPVLFYDNNITLQSNRTSTYHWNMFTGGAANKGPSIDVRNMILWNGATSGNTAATFNLVNYQTGYVNYFGNNWISSVGYNQCDQFHLPCLSIFSLGGTTTNNGATNNPGFQTIPTVNPFNLTLKSGGQAIGLGGVIGSSWATVSKEYVEPNSSTTRPNINDLGWQAFASGGTVPTFLTTSPLTGGTQNVAYSNTLSFSGDVPLTSCTLSSGTQPTGVTWALSGGNCVEAGTPTNSGTFTIALQAANATGNASNGPFTYSLTIAASPIAPTITTTCPLPDGTQGTAYTQTFTATGSPVTSWSISSGSVPTGITPLSGSSGILAGTPTVPGLFTFAVQAANAAGNSINGPIACSINVAAVSGATAAPASR